MGSPDNERIDSDLSSSLAENVKRQRYFDVISANWETAAGGLSNLGYFLAHRAGHGNHGAALY